MCEEEFAVGLPIRFHQVVDFGCRLEDDALHALFSAEFLDIDAREFCYVRLAIDDGGKIGDGGRFIRVEGQRFGL